MEFDIATLVWAMLQPFALHLPDLTMFEAILLLMTTLMLPAAKVIIHLQAISVVSTYKITTRQLASALKHGSNTTTDASQSNLEHALFWSSPASHPASSATNQAKRSLWLPATSPI